MMKREMCHYPDGQHSADCSERLKYEIDVYKNALEYFAREGGQPARDINANMLKELEVKNGA